VIKYKIPLVPIFASGRTVVSATCLAAYYDANDTFISSQFVGSGSETIYVNQELTIPPNAAFVRINGASTQIANLRFEGKFHEEKYTIFKNTASFRYNDNVKDAVVELQLYNQTLKDTYYLKQFGRYANVSGSRRWYFEIWDNTTGLLVFGANNATG